MIFAPLLLAAILDMPSPCEIFSRSELEKNLHWQITGKHDSIYHLPQTSGALCTYDAGEGTVLVTVPDHGSSFFQNNDLVDPFNNQLGLRVSGVGASAELFDNTAYLSKHGRSISIAVLPNDGSADAATLIALAKIAARRMP